MERRKILLGSGAALATVLAGCSSDETGDDESNDDDDGSPSDGGNGDTDEPDDENESDIPGMDTDAMTLDSEKVSIEDINKDGDEVDVVATTTTTDLDVLRAELQSIGETLAAAITDPEAFAAEVNSVTWVLEQDGAMVMSFYVDVQWAIEYINDEIDDDELADLVFETTDE
ncbi:hypothetical protein A6E15_02720 [Natrinema saccharevitans]|uniref:DUF8159 domain-containing protein n=1 Tax=Natrinema saccharevitans TaxID=301967 RepID=A0A1S8ATW6_9EURY|nr:hypothetical protein [Natrinema saccharevitans]OLZ39959.1 hypothetical protein A6E15_02720 [Natrinema saccharevitans]